MEFGEPADNQRQPAGSDTNYEMVSIAIGWLLEKTRALDQALQQWNDPLGLCDVIPGYRSGAVEPIPSSDDAMRLIVFPTDISVDGAQLDTVSLEPRVVSLHHVDNYQAHDVLDGLDGATRMRYTVRVADPTALNGFRGCASAYRLVATLWQAACDVADQMSQLRRVLVDDTEFRLSARDSGAVIQPLGPFVKFMPFLQEELIDADLADSAAVVDLAGELQHNAVLLLDDSAHLRAFVACSDTARERCIALNPRSDVFDKLAQIGFEAGKNSARDSLDNSLNYVTYLGLDARIGNAVESVTELFDDLGEWLGPEGVKVEDWRLHHRVVDRLKARYESVSQQLEELLDNFGSTRLVVNEPNLNALVVRLFRTGNGESQTESSYHVVRDLVWFSLRLQEVGQRYQDVLTPEQFGPAEDADARELAGIANQTFLDLIARTRAVLGVEAD